MSTPKLKKHYINYQFIEELKALPFITEIWLFGSRARGDHQERSDIDLAILCPDATENDWLKIIEIIEKSDTLLKIDCVPFDKSRISKELYKNILKDRKKIYVKNAN